MPFDEFLSFSRDISHGTGGMQILVGLKNYLIDDDLSEKGRKKYRNKQSSDNEENDDEGDERFIS